MHIYPLFHPYIGLGGCSIFSYNRLGENAEEKDAEEIINMATRASVSDQQKQVHENVHFQIKNICEAMDEALIPDVGPEQSVPATGPLKGPHRGGLSFSVGKGTASSNTPGNCFSSFLSVDIFFE